MTRFSSSTSPLAHHPFADLRQKTQMPGCSYKLAEGYGLDVAFTDALDIDEKKMAVWISYADGNRRDGVGDLLVVEGIDESRHRKNPIHLFDHGKSVTLPVGKVEDPETGRYCGIIDSVTKCAKDLVYYYQGTGLPGIDKASEYDHALFCQQVFHLLAQKFIRGGSIGYQVLQARELPPEPMYGTPKGLHLLAVLKLESSTVVMPANADTVRKGLAPDLREVLAMPHVCGKPLSPMLVKSLTPFASEKKAQLGYEGKAREEVNNRMTLVHFDRAVLEECKRLSVGGGAAAGEKAAPLPSQTANQKQMGVRQAADGYYVIDLRTGQNQFGPFFSEGIAQRWAERLNMGKKNVKELRKKYRRTAKGLVRRLKRSSPGSSVIYLAGKDLERARKEAEAKGIKFQHVSSRNGTARVKLIGDDGAIDEVAKSYGRLVKFQGAKALRSNPQDLYDAAIRVLGESRAQRYMSGSIQELHRDYSTAYDRFRKEEERALSDLIALRTMMWKPSPGGGATASMPKEVRRIESSPWNIVLFSDNTVRVSTGGRFQPLTDQRLRAAEEALGRKVEKIDENTGRVKGLKAQPLGDPFRTNINASTAEAGETVIARRAIMQTNNVYEYFAQPGERLTIVGVDAGQMRARNRAGVEQLVISNDVRRKMMGAKVKTNPLTLIVVGDEVEVIPGSGGHTQYHGGDRGVVKEVRPTGYVIQIPGEPKPTAFEKDEVKLVRKKALKDTKSMRNTKKKDGEDLPVGDEATTVSGEERQLPLGAQVLRRLHEDASLLLQDYDEMLGPLENENVKARLQGKLEGFTEELTELEEEFGKLYPDLGGLVGTKEGELEEAADLESDGEPDNDKEEYEDELEPTPKDMDTMDDAAVGSSSEEREEVSPEDALEGMEAAEEEEEGEKSLRNGRKVKSLRRKYGKKGMCPECENAEEDCTCPGETGEKIAPALVAAAAPAVGQLAGQLLTPKDKGYVKEAGGFLGDIGQPDSILDDEGRMKSYHYHKTLSGMAQLDEAREDLEEGSEDLQDSGIPPAEFEPGAGAKGVGSAAAAVAKHPRVRAAARGAVRGAVEGAASGKAADERQRTDKPKNPDDGNVRGERNEITRHVANPAPDPKPGQSTTMNYKGQMEILGQAADFLKELAFLPELDDDYRGRSNEFSKGLNDFVGPDEEASVEDPNEELPPDEGAPEGAPSGAPEGVVMEPPTEGGLEEDTLPPEEEEPGMEMKFLTEEATLQNKKIAELSRMLSRLPI